MNIRFINTIIVVAMATTVLIVFIAVFVSLIRAFVSLIRRVRFSTRGLLAMVAVVAILCAAIVGYRRSSMAQLHWLPSNSPQAESMFPTATITVNRDQDHEYGFLYYSRRNRIQALVRQFPRVGYVSYAIRNESISVHTSDEQTAHEALALLREHDVLAPSTFVIRGKVVDRGGAPISGAIVDLMGPFVFINHFHTRDDGTFTMPLDDGGLKPPAGRGYYLRVRAMDKLLSEEGRWHTAYFSLNEANPEMVVEIVLPR